MLQQETMSLLNTIWQHVIYTEKESSIMTLKLFIE